MSSDPARAIGRRRVCARALAALALLTIFLSGCGGAGGGNYGDKPGSGKVPSAIASVINTGAGPGKDARIKSGADVILSGKDSEGTDSPILRFVWQQIDTTGKTVELIERTNNSVIFTAPRVTQETTLRFRLTTTDADGDSTSTTIAVTVVPIGDANQFLTYLLSHPNDFTLVATLDRGTTTTSAVSFHITQATGVTYADRTSSGAPNRTLILDSVPKSTPAQFVDGTTANWNSVDEAIGAFYSPHFVVRIPQFDVDEVNKRFQSSGRDLRLEPQFVDRSNFFIDLGLTVDAGTCRNEVNAVVSCQDRVVLYVLRNDGTRLPLQAGRTSYRLSVTDLYAQQSTQPGQVSPESAATAAAYFRAVDPNNRRTKLSDWLQLSGFTVNGTLIPASQYAHATYVNNFDLGFGRDMFLRVDQATGNVYAYVNNYPTLEAALKKLNNFATVVMEYSPPDGNPSGRKFVKFFAFVPDDSGDSVRQTSFNFDGRGEKWMPGVCTACHGGRPTFLASGEYDKNGNVNAGFLPWDLDSLLYTRATSPAQVDPDLNAGDFTEAVLQQYSRSSQEAQLKKLNEGAIATYQDGTRFAVVNQLVHGWYGDTTAPYDTLPSATFNGNYVQPGWAVQETLYHGVFARYCRSCHSNNDKDTFATFDALLLLKEDVRELVFETGAMPLARLTHDRFWVPFGGTGTPPAELLRAALNTAGENVTGINPGQPIARITGAPQIAMNQDQIRLNGADSASADAFLWRFVARPAGSTAQLVGATTNAPAFRIDRPGAYQVELVVSNALGASAPALVNIRADSLAPFQSTPAAGVTPNASVIEGGTAPITSSVLRFQDNDTAADQLRYTITAQPATGQIVQTATGSTTTFTQADIDAGLVQYRHNSAENTSDDATFAISDGSTTLSGQRIQFIVVPVNDSPTLIRNLPLSLAEGSTAALDAGALSVADADNSATQIFFNVLVPPAHGTLNLLNFTQRDIDLNNVLYAHDGGETMSDTFRLQASDGVATLGPIDVLINIIPVADSPTAVRTGPLSDAVRGRDTTITRNQLRFDDADTPAAGLIYTVTGAPTNGVLTNGSIVLGTFTQQDINDGRVIYRNLGDLNDLAAASADAFNFSITDGTTPSGVRTFNIIVNPAPDAPMRGTSDLFLQALGLASTSPLTASDLQYRTSAATLVTYTVTRAPQRGTLLVNGTAASSFSQNDVDLGRVTYLPADLTVTIDTFQFRASSQVQPGVVLTVPAPALPAETFTINVGTSFSKDVARIFRVRYDPTRRVCMECHCPSNSPACTISPPPSNEPGISPAQMPDWSADPVSPTGLLQQILLNVNVNDPQNSLVLQKPRGLLGHPGGLRPGFDLGGVVNGDRSRHDILLRWIQEGCRGPNDAVTNCAP